MEKLTGQLVNFDYEYALFDSDYKFDAHKFVKMRQRFEYVYLLCQQEKPLYTQINYGKTYLDQLRNLGIELPDLVKDVGENWVGKLKNIELEQLVNSKVYSSGLRSTLFSIDDFVVVNSEEDIEKLAQLNSSDIILKSPYLFSGIGHQKIKANDPIKKQPPFIAEVFYEKCADLSVRVNGDEVSFFECINHNGKFRGFKLNHGDSPYVSKFKNQMKDASLLVKNNLKNTGYEGIFSIDMMVYMQDGVEQLHPLIEINARRTMNEVALSLNKLIGLGEYGEWLISLKLIDHPDIIRTSPDNVDLHSYFIKKNNKEAVESLKLSVGL